MRALTPVLLAGPDGRSEEVRNGRLADGLEGTLVHQLFAEGRNRREYTVVLTEVPETIAYARAIICRYRDRLGDADLAQLPAERWQRAEFESAEFNRRYQLFTLTGQDPVFTHELFSPALISWLSVEVPPGFGFELNDGFLTVFRDRHLEGVELESLCSLAASLAARIRTEATEEGAGTQLFQEREVQAAIEKALPVVEFDHPPATVQDAIGAYTSAAGRRPLVLAKAILYSALGAAAAAGAGYLAAGPIGAGIAAIVVFLIAFVVVRTVASYRYHFGDIHVQRLGYEAWVRGYARERGLAIEDRWAFHAAMRGLSMPGVADHVLSGSLPGGELEGRFVIFGSAPEMRSSGQEIAYVADRPLAASGILVELRRDPPVDRADQLAPLPDEYSVETHGRFLLIWRPVAGNLIRTSEGSDRFCRKAAAIVEATGVQTA